MFVKNLSRKDIIIRNKGKVIRIEAGKVTCIDELIVTKERLKALYKNNICILGELIREKEEAKEIINKEHQKVVEEVKVCPTCGEVPCNCDICACNPETCQDELGQACADIGVPQDAEVIETPQEVIVEEVKVCEKCGKEPCECGKEVEEPVCEECVFNPPTEEVVEEVKVCEKCGKEPCECDKEEVKEVVQPKKRQRKKKEQATKEIAE